MQRCKICESYKPDPIVKKGECTFRTFPASVTAVPLNRNYMMKDSDGATCKVFVQKINCKVCGDTGIQKVDLDTVIEVDEECECQTNGKG